MGYRKHHYIPHPFDDTETTFVASSHGNIGLASTDLVNA